MCYVALESKKGIKRVIFPSLGLRLREMKTLVGVRAYKNKCKTRRIGRSIFISLLVV